MSAGIHLRILALGAVVDAAEEAAGFTDDTALQERAHHLLLASQFLVRQVEAELMLLAERPTVETTGADSEGGTP